MKIVGNKEDINMITLIHKGKEVKFQCIPRQTPYMPRIDLERDKEAEIVFDDLLEVNELISMLERFRDECRGYIGHWNKT